MMTLLQRESGGCSFLLCLHVFQPWSHCVVNLQVLCATLSLFITGSTFYFSLCRFFLHPICQLPNVYFFRKNVMNWECLAQRFLLRWMKRFKRHLLQTSLYHDIQWNLLTLQKGLCKVRRKWGNICKCGPTTVNPPVRILHFSVLALVCSCLTSCAAQWDGHVCTWKISVSCMTETTCVWLRLLLSSLYAQACLS